MARIRSFKPEFWSDDKTARLSREARLLFFGLLTEADDFGRLVFAVRRLVGVIYPFDHDVTPQKFHRWLSELVEVGMVRPYDINGASYLHIVNFEKHQRVTHKAKSSLPPPPPRNSGESPESVQNGSGGTLEILRPLLGNKGTRDRGKPKRSLPDDFVLTDEMRRWAAENTPDLDAAFEFERFCDHARGKDRRQVDWNAAWRNWLRQSVEYAGQRAGAGQSQAAKWYE